MNKEKVKESIERVKEGIKKATENKVEMEYTIDEGNLILKALQSEL